MLYHHYPVLCWDDGQGLHTAVLVENAWVSAVGLSRKAALSQVKEFLRTLHDEGRAGPPQLSEPELLRLSVKVRPEYITESRVFPCDWEMALPVDCVRSNHTSGLACCSIPLLGIEFHYHDQRSLRRLIRHAVRERLAAHSPDELTRFFPPPGVELADVSVKSGRPRDVAPAPSLPTLQAVADPIGSSASRRLVGKAYGRDAEVADLVRRLSEEGSNVILLGEEGTGKTCVLAEAARRLERGRAGGHRVWLTSAARIVAGMRYLGQWEERCENLVREIGGLGGVLCVESLLDLLATGGQGPRDSLAAFLSSFLERGELQMVGEATPRELEVCRRLLPGFADMFSVLALPAFTPSQAAAVLEQVGRGLARERRVGFEPEAREQAYRLHQRFAPYRAFPGETVAFLRNLAHTREGQTVTGGDVVARFSGKTGLPEVLLRDERCLEERDVLEFFRNEVAGQEEACRAAASVVLTFKAGLNDPQRPLGVLLFCGPTGVGKTELARAICRYFFGSEERLVRLDMSEYAGPGAVTRLTGSGGRPGPLIHRMRQQPFSVVLLDEIEKAAPEIFDLLLGMFDEGRLTDPLGRVTTFRSALVIMTSNLGAESLRPIGLSPRPQPSYTGEVMAHFRPEFFNRIDAVVSFSPLAPEVVRAIAARELARLEEREGLRQRGIKLDWEDDLIDRLCELGYDQRYGARPLLRTLEETVVVPVARFLVEHPHLREIRLRLSAGERHAVVEVA